MDGKALKGSTSSELYLPVEIYASPSIEVADYQKAGVRTAQITQHISATGGDANDQRHHEKAGIPIRAARCDEWGNSVRKMLLSGPEATNRP